MNVAARPVATGKTRTCPHCKAVILESLSICPGCLHHLRFDQEAAKRQVAATDALRVEAVIRHPPLEEPWEYFVVIAVRNDKGEEISRQVVNVGALQPAEKRTFTLAVEVMPPQAPPEPKQAQPPAMARAGNMPPPLQAPPYQLKPPGLKPPGSTSAPASQRPASPASPATASAPSAARPTAQTPAPQKAAQPPLTPAQAAGLKPPPIGGPPPGRK